MDNKAKIRYRVLNVFDKKIAVEILWIDSRVWTASILLDNNKCLKFAGIKLIVNEVQFFDTTNAKAEIEFLHENFGQFAVKLDCWRGDVWWWKRCKKCKGKGSYNHVSISGDEYEVVCKDCDGKGSLWLPWSPDMPIPKPSSLGNNTWEV